MRTDSAIYATPDLFINLILSIENMKTISFLGKAFLVLSMLFSGFAPALSVFAETQGCVDPAANNYNPSADTYDGSCTYGGPDQTTMQDLTDLLNIQVDTNAPHNFNLDAIIHLVASDYTTESWQPYFDAVQDGINVERNASSTDADISPAIDGIQSTRDALVLIGGNSTSTPLTLDHVAVNDLENTISGLEVGMEYSYDGGDYVTYDPNNFNVDLKGEHTLSVRVAATDSDPASDPVIFTFANNRDDMDFSAWELLHEQFQPQHQHHNDLSLLLKQEADYTGDSWSVYIAAIQNAGSIFDNDLDPSQAELNAAIQQLSDALAQLEPVANPDLPDAPSVTADDENNVIVGFAEGMEYNHIEQNDMWVNWSENNNPTFDGNDTVWVRFTETGSASSSNIIVLHFTGASDPTDKSALQTALENEFTTTIGDYGHLTLDQSDYSTSSWDGYIQALINGVGVFEDASSTQGDIDVAVDALSTAKSALVLLPNNNGTSTPAAPDVSANDTTNTVSGMNSTLEYNLDNAGYLPYGNGIIFNALDLSGNHTLLVRVAATGSTPADDVTTLTFTTNPVSNGGGNIVGTVGGSGGVFAGPINGNGPFALFVPTAVTTALPFGIGGPVTPFVFSSNGQVLGASTFVLTSNLQFGMRNGDVTELQNFLTEAGVYSGPITGYFGPLTLAAVKRYQAQEGLPQTGFVGPLTRGRINAFAQSNNANVLPSSSLSTMTITELINLLEASGSIGSDKAAQARVIFAGR